MLAARVAREGCAACPADTCGLQETVFPPGYLAALHAHVIEDESRPAFPSILATALPAVARGNNKKALVQGFFDGRYWARTSDPQLIELGQVFALVRSGSLRAHG